ncbi:MAG: gamma-glutamyl-gamma-aminobutyrate hydrolase family protein [Thermostichales cyanobacterium SZTDM-1c_bins_54]
MTPPIIGISLQGRRDPQEYFLQRSYVEAVRAAGGVPILLPPGETHPKRVLDLVDGLILSGGGDMHPETYGGDPHPAIDRVDPERDEFELALASYVLEREMPVLGICRGHQVLTVATGGRLIPHVPDQYGFQVLHVDQQTRDPITHPVSLKPESRLGDIACLGEIEVVSWHHQAVCDVPEHWEIVGWAPDGLIEALEHKDHPWAITVQWHPERSYQQPYHKKLFRALVQAAAV